MSQLAFILFFLLGVCACSVRDYMNRGYRWHDRTLIRPNMYFASSRNNINRFYSHPYKTDQQNHYFLNQNSFQIPIFPNPKYPTIRISSKSPVVEDYVLEKNENTSNKSKTIRDESEYIERPEDFRNIERETNSETAISSIAKQRRIGNQSNNQTSTNEESISVSSLQENSNYSFLTGDLTYNSTEFTLTVSPFPSENTRSSTANTSTQNTSTTTNEVASSDVPETNISSNISSTTYENPTSLQNTTINDQVSTDTSESSISLNITATETSTLPQSTTISNKTSKTSILPQNTTISVKTSETSKESTGSTTSNESTTRSDENTSETTDAKTTSTASEELTSNTATESSSTDISPESSSITSEEVTSKPTISIATDEESSPISSTIPTKKIETSTDEVTSSSTDEVTSTSTDEVTSTSTEITPTEHLKIIDNSKIRTVKVALSVVFVSITFFGTIAVGIYFLKRRRQRIPYEQLTLQP